MSREEREGLVHVVHLPGATQLCLGRELLDPAAGEAVDDKHGYTLWSQLTSPGVLRATHAAAAMRQDDDGHPALALRQEQLAGDGDALPGLDAVPEVARAQRECLELDVALEAMGHRRDGLARGVKYEFRQNQQRQRQDNHRSSTCHMASSVLPLVRRTPALSGAQSASAEACGSANHRQDATRRRTFSRGFG